MHIQRFECNPVAVNTYLLYDETQEAALIDCGAFSPQEQEAIQDCIKRQGLRLKRLLNTHRHFDHLLGNRFIYETYGLRPEYHAAEDTLPDISQQTRLFGFPADSEPIAPGPFLQDGDEIRFGNTVLIALLTPGHSPGSLSFYCKESRCVFTGDALFRHDIGRTDLWGGSEEILLRSIRTRLLTLPGETVVYPGHGPQSTIEEEKQHNPYIQ
jgi:glyoxylase-like metal-dependent hydrolase (beta-lactamase superfamily II)